MDVGGYLTYTYKFNFEQKDIKEFKIKLAKKTLNLVQEEGSAFSSGQLNLPEWTKLTYYQCQNCPLDQNKYPYCPIAVNMVRLISFFDGFSSFEDVEVIVETAERNYAKKTDVQTGVSSLIGIYMTTTDCSILSKLKPMVRFHLPFATIEETQYRVFSMYLLAQYFLSRCGKEADWQMKKLSGIYDMIGIVNKYFSQRLKSAEIRDTSVNAVVILDIFAKYINFSIDQEGMLKEIEYLFEAYFR